MQVIGADIGYSHVKVVTTTHHTIFPSVVGTADRPRFGLDDHAHILLHYPTGDLYVGQGAIDHSRFLDRREDRGWIHTAEYNALVDAALSEVDTGDTQVRLVTGLPLAYYSDKDDLRQTLLGSREVHRDGRTPATYEVIAVRVLPQPFGSLLSVALNPDGTVRDASLLTNLVGVIDVGGHTTNVLTAIGGTEQVRATTSVPSGAWDVMRSVQAQLSETCRESHLNAHQLMEAIVARRLSYFGRDVDLTTVVEKAIKTLSDRVISAASQLWGAGADLRSILVTGGGAHLLGDHIRAHFSRHEGVTVLDEPVYANAAGYYRFGRWLEERGKW